MRKRTVADDIIARLNEVWEYAPTYPWQRNAINDAKAEIERLRAERDAERALADDLYAVLSRLQPLTNGSSAQQRYLEARRG